MENRIKILRKERNLTQDELAKIIGVVRTTIAGYERGVICPSQDKLILLANTLVYQLIILSVKRILEMNRPPLQRIYTPIYK